MPSLQSQVADAILRRVVKAPAHKVPSVTTVRLGVESAFLLYTRTHPVSISSARVNQNNLCGEWLRPRGGRRDRTILFLHGGGYFFGSPRTHRPITVALAGLTGSQVFSLNYRLAPEHPYPAALEDAQMAYRWLLEQGIDPQDIVFAGDSAGGGLCLATLLALRDSGQPLPAAAICFSPWTDLAGTGPSMVRNDQKCAMFTAEAVREMAQLYLNGADPCSPLVSPLYADLRGLPPLLFHASDTEVLLDDSVRTAEKAREAGVDVLLNIWPRQPHVWQLFTRLLPEANQSLAQAADFVNWYVPERKVHSVQIPYSWP